MQKVLLALTLIAAVANGQYLLNNVFVFNSDYYNIDIDISGDIGYMTTYGATASATDVTESYGLRFYSLITANIA